jgi:hypothetical protein
MASVCPPCKVANVDPNDFRITIGHVAVSANNILTFTLKEECAEKIPVKNTYIVKVQGIEMNNLSRVDKVKVEDGVYQFTVDLTAIAPALQNGTNTLEVEGTANMLVCGASSLDGFYALSCGQNTLSIYSGNGIYLPPGTDLPAALAGFYSRRVIGTNSVIYEKFTNGNKYIVFFYAPQGRWFIKQTIANGVPANLIFFQQGSSGSQDEVPLKDWVAYVAGGFPPNHCSKGLNLGMQACIPFEGASSDLILVNCGGIDEANGCYYKDAANNQFVNVRNPNLVIRYVVNQQTAQAFWQIQDISAVFCGGSAAVLYNSPNVQSTGNTACGSCVPCCDWTKECGTSPADAPQVTPLEYFDPTNPSHSIRYFDNGSSTWSLFEGTTQAATGTSDHYIVVRAGSTAPEVNGAYCLTCVNPNNCPDYTRVLDTTIVLGHNPGAARWEIRTSPTPGVGVIYFSNSTDSSVPPFDGWVRAAAVAGDVPLVLSSVVPSCVTWTLL